MISGELREPDPKKSKVVKKERTKQVKQQNPIEAVHQFWRKKK